MGLLVFISRAANADENDDEDDDDDDDARRCNR